MFVFVLLSVPRLCHRFECFDTIVDRIGGIVVYMWINGLQALSTEQSERHEWCDDLLFSSIR